MDSATDNRYLTERTVESIRTMISESDLGLGERFATEAELEEKLDVSRGIIREAVNQLRAWGILESRRGLGLLLTKPDPVHLFRQGMMHVSPEQQDLVEWVELRYAMEVGAAKLAAERITEAQVDKLSRLIDEFTDAHAGRRHDRVIDEIELEFHCTILEATHSPMLARMHDVLITFFARSANEIDGYPADTVEEEDTWEHRQIGEALATHDAERARILLCGHLRRLITQYKSGAITIRI